VITASPPPPAVEQPAPYELSHGVVAGVAAPGTRRVIVRVGARTLADLPLRGRHFELRVSLPAAETTVQVVTVDRSGHRSRATVPHALARSDGTPRPGSTLDGLLHRMLVYSDNEAANATESYFGGSTLGGSTLVDSLMESLGLVDTDMYGGYELEAVGSLSRTLAGRIPIEVDSEPSGGRGKKTSAYDLGSLLRAVWLASGGRGPLRAAQPEFTPSDARYVLYLLAHMHDPGKLDRRVGHIPGIRVLHKAGWIDSARHDNGIVLWPGGAILVTVMTYCPAGAGLSSDVLAGDVAAAALRRLRG